MEVDQGRGMGGKGAVVVAGRKTVCERVRAGGAALAKKKDRDRT